MENENKNLNEENAARTKKPSTGLIAGISAAAGTVLGLTIGVLITCVILLNSNDISDNTQNSGGGSETTTEESIGTTELIYNVGSNTCVVTGITDKNITEVIIPEKFEGKKVVGINERVFENCKEIKKVTIPNSVTSIGDSAFNSSGDIQENHKKQKTAFK